jgi:hypothetical protein
MNNFVGNWWVGVVENTEDPLKNGRCKVRIFGYHTENLLALPTKNLPWCSMGIGPSQPDSFSAPIPGDYVTGYFADGESGQNPYIVAILPGIQSKPWDTSKGFSPQRLDPAAPQTEAEIAKPVLPEGVTEREIGQPTTPKTSRGIIENTGISVTNSQLSHVCDFRYKLEFDIGLAGLTNPITAIQNAIKAGKNNAALLIGSLIQQLNDGIRTSIKALILAMNLDPSGQLSTIYAKLKFKLQDINDYIEKVAKYVEIAATVKYLVEDIQQIITYLQNLPARLKAIAQDCITTFTNSAKAFASQVAATPGQVGATVAGLAASLQSSADSVLSGLKSDVSSIEIPTQLQSVFSSPSVASADTLTTYISQTYSTPEETQAQAPKFDLNSLEWA